MTDKEFDEAVAKAVKAQAQEDAQVEEASAHDVTGGTVFWAIVAGAISPIIGGGYGVYQLAKGRTNKGALYVGVAIVMFVISFAIMSG